MPIDYVTLRVLWWFLLGVLLIGFAIMDGFDLGVAMLLGCLGRNDGERRVLINTIGPTWEGNQVWFILGGGAIFAAWPTLYAVSFSGFYLAMLVVLLALILRPVGFKYRSKLSDPRWRLTWDVCLSIGGFVPALIFGVAMGNVLQGVPFHFDADLRSFYSGSFFGLLNPFAILCGVVSVLMCAQHGALFAATKTEGVIQQRARRTAKVASIAMVVLFITAGYWVGHYVIGYRIDGAIAFDGPSNPLNKSVITTVGAWMQNYYHMPWLYSVPATGIVGALLSCLLADRGESKLAFTASAVSVAGIIGTVGVSMFPIILPSSSNPAQSLTVWDASSSHLTLFVMTIATVFFMPIILAYTAWVYRVLRGKVSLARLLEQDEAY